MTERPDDLVRVATGELTWVQVLGNALADAGLQGRVVGGDLTAGLGSALPDQAELWVHRNDVAAAERVIAGNRPHGAPAHGHPTDAPKPDPTRGPVHGAPPHRPLPS